LIFYLTALLILIADQLTKVWIRTHLRIGEYLFKAGFVRIIRIPPNTGAAFGLFRGYQYVLAAISAVSAIAIIVCAIFFSRRFLWLNTRLSRFAMGLVLGGTVGNLIDRLQPELGGVTDFISIGVWPSFNIADSAIVIGVILFSFVLLRLLRDDKL
jgi:signal peptidase II